MIRSRHSRIPLNRQRCLPTGLALAAMAACLTLSSFALAATDPKASKYYEDALGRFQKKDFAGAVIQLKNSLQIDKDQLPAQLLMGKALLADSDLVGAEVAFNEALRLGVDRAEVVVPLGQAMLGQGKHQQLFDQPKFLPTGLPRGVQTQMLLLRATAHMDLGSPGEAFRAIDEARTIDPGSPESWMAEVPLRIRTRQFKEAHAAADRAIALAPNLAEALYLKGSIAHAQSQVPVALGFYERALKLQPNHLEALVARAGLLIDAGRPAEAAATLEAARQVAPSEPRAAYLRAVLAEQRGDAAATKEAMAEIVGLLDPVPVNFLRFRPQLLMLGGLAHFSLGNQEKAKPYLEGVLRLNPQAPVAKLLARVYLSESSVEKAVDVLTVYLRGTPQDTQAMMLLGAAHMQLGRHARATALLQDALKVRDESKLRTALGISLMNEGKTEAAVSELEATFRKDPAQTYAGVALVGMHLQAGQARKALAVADTLVKRSPQQAGHHNLLGMARGESGDLKGARTAFEQALKLDPKFTLPQLNLARLDIASRNFDAASVRLNGLLQQNDKSTDALLEMGLLQERRDQPDEATRWYTRAADVSATADLKPLLQLVDFHMRYGRPEAALEASKQLIGRAPENLDALLSSARVLIANGEMAKARATLGNAARLANFDTRRLTQIGELQVRANDLAGASYALQKAQTADPGHLESLALLTDVDLRSGDVNKAEQRAKEVLNRHPKSAAGHLLMGDVALARGNLAASVEAFKRAHQMAPGTMTLLRWFQASELTQPDAAHQLVEQWLKSNPNDIDARRALADAYARGGQLATARRHYEAVIKVQPGRTDVLNNLANVLLMQKDGSAVKVAEQAVKSDPGNANAIDTLGWILFQTGQRDKALPLLRDARLRAPANAEIRIHLAEALAASGQPAQAREEFEAVLKTEPAASPRAKQAQDRLKQLR